MAAAAKEGLAKKLKDAETRADVLSEQLSDLQSSLERQRAAADSRYIFITVRSRKLRSRTATLIIIPFKISRVR